MDWISEQSWGMITLIVAGTIFVPSAVVIALFTIYGIRHPDAKYVDESRVYAIAFLTGIPSFLVCLIAPCILWPFWTIIPFLLALTACLTAWLVIAAVISFALRKREIREEPTNFIESLHLFAHMTIWVAVGLYLFAGFVIMVIALLLVRMGFEP